MLGTLGVANLKLGDGTANIRIFDVSAKNDQNACTSEQLAN